MSKAFPALALLLILALGLFTGILARSELRLREFIEPRPFTSEIPNDATSVKRGEHIARTRGCFGCHGQHLEGRVFTDEWPWVKRAVAPNLARYARQQTTSSLNAAIRHGIGHNGRALWSMPSYNWKHLSDDDFVALISYLRSAVVVQKELPKPKLGLRARWQIGTGKSQHMADWALAVPKLEYQDHPNAALRNGEYLAMTMCNECHGLDLRGATNPDGNSPDLAVLVAYSEDDFRELMRTGTAIGNRDDLFLMSMIARDRFWALTEQELTDLFVYLRTLPDQPVPQDVPWRGNP
ncbi:MAG: c-type cytochrome [Pseudomonadota bacterium]